MSPAPEKQAITAKNYLTVGPGEHPCGNNLYLIVTDAGGRNWSFRYQRDGIKKKMGLGSARDVKLSEAKDRAIDSLRLLAKGTIRGPTATPAAGRKARACSASSPRNGPRPSRPA